MSDHDKGNGVEINEENINMLEKFQQMLDNSKDSPEYEDIGEEKKDYFGNLSKLLGK